MTANPLWATLWTLLAYVGGLSLISFGGINSVLPSIHTLAVHDAHWMTDRDFVTLYAIAQAAPGPNVLIVTLIGYRAAGLAGAVVATLAMCVPTSIVAFFVVRVWDRFREARWRRAVQAGLVPVTIGFLAAAVLVIVRGADVGITGGIITAATAAVAYATKLNPLWMFAVGGALGAVGLA